LHESDYDSFDEAEAKLNRFVKAMDLKIIKREKLFTGTYFKIGKS